MTSRARKKAVADARSEAERAASSRLTALAEALRVPPDGSPAILSDASQELTDIRAALQEGWVLRGQEREEAVEAALSRLSAFLQVAIEAPLSRALAAESGGSMRDGVEDALGAIEDLEFFLEPPPGGGGPTDLRPELKDVVGEFASAWPDQRVRERIPEGEFTARCNPDAFKDAVYLVLHNAAIFGDNGPIDVVLDEKGHEILVIVRDKGPGFSAEALLSALDPFYSTSDGGLGMGLPQAKRLIEGQGGALRFRNMRKAGAEVTLALPKAG
jgi:signal transduction histidine kinase